MQEIEIKLKIGDPETLFKKILGIGGIELKSKEGLERDVMYDDGRGFYDYPKVLRLRTTSHGNFLTYKEKNEHSDRDSFLVRTELETQVGDAKITDQILSKLGFFPYRIKEKYRREISFDGLVIEFHKMPFIGDFIEVEGEKEGIKRLLSKLELDFNQGINKDYSALHYEFCDARGLSRETPMTFEAERSYLQK